jgi:RHS repeat-associated protein
MSKTCFLWDPIEDNIVREVDGGGAPVAEYTTEPRHYGNVISQYRGGVEGQFHFDGQGSTLASTGDNQQVSDTFAYVAFGEVTGRTGTTKVPFLFTGERGYYTAGHILARRREYDPATARWLSGDPRGMLSVDVNLYSFARNNTLHFYDPSGESIIVVGGGLCAIALYVGGCLYIESSWDTERQARPFSATEAQCLTSAFNFVPPASRCYGLAISPTVPHPETMCHPFCNLTGGFGSSKTYLGPSDVDCSRCSGFINTIMTLIHECQHHKQNCAWQATNIDCAEVWAYEVSMHQLRTFVRNKCDQIARDGFCPSELQCRREVDSLIQSEQRDPTYLEHKRRCGH